MPVVSYEVDLTSPELFCLIHFLYHCYTCMQAQLLAEMDEEFGVGDLIQGTLQQQAQKVH